MARELERAGIPTAYFTAIPTIPLGLGTPRIVRGAAITHLLGDPGRSPEQERALRRRLVELGLQVVQTAVSEPRLFGLEELR